MNMVFVLLDVAIFLEIFLLSILVSCALNLLTTPSSAAEERLPLPSRLYSPMGSYWGEEMHPNSDSRREPAPLRLSPELEPGHQGHSMRLKTPEVETAFFGGASPHIKHPALLLPSRYRC